MPKVYFATDHAGLEGKNHLLEYVKGLGYEVEDCGAFEYDKDDDYPDFIIPCAKKVAADPESFGVILGASGQGEAMGANRVPGARAALYYGAPKGTQTDMTGKELDMIASTREHNNANILSLGGRFLSTEEMEVAVKVFLSTPFPGEERHARRIGKLG